MKFLIKAKSLVLKYFALIAAFFLSLFLKKPKAHAEVLIEEPDLGPKAPELGPNDPEVEILAQDALDVSIDVVEPVISDSQAIQIDIPLEEKKSSEITLPLEESVPVEEPPVFEMQEASVTEKPGFLRSFNSFGIGSSIILDPSTDFNTGIKNRTYFSGSPKIKSTLLP